MAKPGQPRLGLARTFCLIFEKRSRTQNGADFYGVDDRGPLYVSDLTADLHPTCKNFIDAGRQLGIPVNTDFNGEDQAGIGLYQLTVKDGRRMSAARAYLHPARKRKKPLD